MEAFVISVLGLGVGSRCRSLSPCIQNTQRADSWGASSNNFKFIQTWALVSCPRPIMCKVCQALPSGMVFWSATEAVLFLVPGVDLKGDLNFIIYKPHVPFAIFVVCCVGSGQWCDGGYANRCTCCVGRHCVSRYGSACAGLCRLPRPGRARHQPGVLSAHRGQAGGLPVQPAA